jgi:hypothetical protein
MSASDVVARLRLKPEFAHSVGEERRTPKGMPLLGVYAETYCCFLRPHPSKMAPAEFLSRDAGRLKKHQRFFAAVRRAGGRVEYYLGLDCVGSAGEVFGSDLLEQLAAMRIDFSIEAFSTPQRR